MAKQMGNIVLNTDNFNNLDDISYFWIILQGR